MTRRERKYTTAASLVFVSATLHLLIAGLGFAACGVQMMLVTLLWAALGLGLLRNWRCCAYLALTGMFFSVSMALFGAMDTVEAVSILFWIIVAINALAAAILLDLLWAPPPYSASLAEHNLDTASYGYKLI